MERLLDLIPCPSRGTFRSPRLPRWWRSHYRVLRWKLVPQVLPRSRGRGRSIVGKRRTPMSNQRRDTASDLDPESTSRQRMLRPLKASSGLFPFPYQKHVLSIDIRVGTNVVDVLSHNASRLHILKHDRELVLLSPAFEIRIETRTKGSFPSDTLPAIVK